MRVQGLHRIEIVAKDGSVSEAVVRLRYKRLHVLPPVGKQKRYPALDLTVIHAREATRPKNRERIDWKLVTDLDVTSPEQDVEKLQWYAQRWKTELFHKILKSGCRVETARLRTAERLAKMIAVFCILGWRIFWMTMIGRAAPSADPQLALTEAEITVLDRVVPDRRTIPSVIILSRYVTKIACLGGYLARAGDLPPGNTVIWRGWSRLMDIMRGVELIQPKCNLPPGKTVIWRGCSKLMDIMRSVELMQPKCG